MCVCVFVFQLQEKAISIWESKGFFIDLEPLPGGVEAVKEMARMDEYVLKMALRAAEELKVWR